MHGNLESRIKDPRSGRLIEPEEIRTMNFNSLFQYEKDFFGGEFREKLLEGIDVNEHMIYDKRDKAKLVPLTTDILMYDRDSWVSNTMSTHIFANADKYLPGGAFEAGKHFVKNLPDMRGRLSFVNLLTVPMFFSISAKENDKYNTTNIARTEKVGKNHYQLFMYYNQHSTEAYTGDLKEPRESKRVMHPSVCRSWYPGCIDMYFGLLATDIEINEVQCVDEDPSVDCCIYDITWTDISPRRKVTGFLYSVFNHLFDTNDDESLIRMQDVSTDTDQVIYNSGRVKSRLVKTTQKLNDNNKLIAKELDTINDQLELVRDRITELMYIDVPTNIPNRRYFNDYFEKRWSSSVRENEEPDEPMSVILMDIDHFKKYNDTYGHPEGDRCLNLVAETLQSSIRGSDFVVRWGGEEFAIVLPSTDYSGAEIFAQRIQKSISALGIEHAGSDVSDNLTLSMGIAKGRPTQRSDLDVILENADQALYQSKENGRNMYTFYGGEC